MELYKFINSGKVKKYNGGFVVLDDKVYTNPREDVLKAVGFKPLEMAAVPVIDEGSQYLVTKYTENDETITVSYEPVEISE